MKGVITARIEGLLKHYPVERISATPKLELFKIFGRNGFVVYQSNRPTLRANGLKMKRIEWKLIEGQLRSTSAKDALAKALDEYIKQMEQAGKL